MFHHTARTRILVALAAGASTGMDLVRCRAARRGTVYVHLDRMEDAGLIRSTPCVPYERPSTYVLTLDGRALVESMIRPPRPLRDPKAARGLFA